MEVSNHHFPCDFQVQTPLLEYIPVICGIWFASEDYEFHFLIWYVFHLWVSLVYNLFGRIHTSDLVYRGCIFHVQKGEDLGQIIATFPAGSRPQKWWWNVREWTPKMLEKHSGFRNWSCEQKLAQKNSSTKTMGFFPKGVSFKVKKKQLQPPSRIRNQWVGWW